MSISSNTVLTPDHLHAVVDHFMEKPAFSFDTETTGPNRGVPVIAPVSWLSMATDGMAVSIPMGHPNGSRLISRATRKKDKVTNKFDMIPAVWSAPPPQMRPSQVWSIVEPLFMSDRLKIAQGATFDLIGTAKYFGGRVVPGPYADTIVMQWLLDENMKVKGLKEMVRKYYGVDYDKEGVGKCVEIWGFSKVARYAFLDAKFAYFLWKKFAPMLTAENLDQIFSLEMDLLPVLCDMNLEGARVDVDELLSLKEDLSERLVGFEADIYKAAGKRFNINSNPQKVQVLFGSKEGGGQGLTPREFTDKKQPSTSASALEHFPNNKVVQALGRYQEIATLLNTYVIGYLGDADAGKPCRIHNGKIHADLVQYGTVTGRFSCRIPNLQNIPRPDTELGRRVRGLFIS
jgi:DNA polymerase I-like protein with 3'-5' exonuclease and polymerase domains